MDLVRFLSDWLTYAADNVKARVHLHQCFSKWAESSPRGQFWWARVEKTKGGEKHRGGENAQPLIDDWVNFSVLLLLQPLRWCCVDCVIHHEQDVREEQHHTYMWREQAITEWPWHVNSIVACCHGAKLCAYAARDFRSQHCHDLLVPCKLQFTMIIAGGCY